MSNKRLISAFIVLNIVTVLFMNRPKAMVQAGEEALEACPSPGAAKVLRGLGTMEQVYAHMTGLDNMWKMFGHLPRFDWWYVIKARYADDATVVLPLPRQSQRTIWQHTFADFKEAKFYQNLYSDRSARRAYADYLCRLYPRHGGAPVEAIVWELHSQRIFGPSEATVRGSHLDSRTRVEVLDVFPCRPDRKGETP